MYSLMKKLFVIPVLILMMFSMFHLGEAQAKSEMIRLASASIGGLWYVYAANFAEMVKKYNPEFQIQVEATGGPAPNIRLIEAGNTEIAFTTNSHAFLAMNGMGWAKGKKYKNMRSMFLLYPSKTSIVVLEKSDVKKFSDIEGKVVSPGPAGSGADGLTRDALKILNIKPSKIVNVSQADLAQGLRDGLIKVGIFNGGQPFPAIVELEKTHRIRHIEMSTEERRKISSQFPFYMEIDLSNKGYKYMPKDFKTLAIYSFVIARKEVSEDLVYKLMKTMFEHIDEFRKIIKAASDTTLEGIKYINVPLHPGALKFYKEKGIPIPQNLIPHE